MKLNTAKVIARAIMNQTVAPLTWTPALGVSEIMAEYNSLAVDACQYSFNEETAYTVAHGGAIYGSFSASIIKTHGLLKAANSVSDSMFVELSGAMALIVIDDQAGIRSDSIIFAEKILTALEMPFTVSSAETIYDDIEKAFDRSAALHIPRAVVIDTADVLNGETEYNVAAQVMLRRNPFQRRPERQILFPLLTGYQRKVLDARLAGKEIPEAPSLPRIPDDIPPYWRPAIKRYTPLMNALKSLKTEHGFISSDIGFYASFSFPPFDVQDVCTFMGGSISLAAGAVLGGCNDAWAVVGDFTFIAAGHLPLLDPGIPELPIKIILIDNGMAETTGKQLIDRDAITRALELAPGHVTHLDDPLDKDACQRALKKVESAKKIHIVVAHYSLSESERDSFANI